MTDNPSYLGKYVTADIERPYLPWPVALALEVWAADAINSVGVFAGHFTDLRVAPRVQIGCFRSSQPFWDWFGHLAHNRSACRQHGRKAQNSRPGSIVLRLMRV